eukprot:PhM_4_TR11712/c1_g1_i1/m.29539
MATEEIRSIFFRALLPSLAVCSQDVVDFHNGRPVTIGQGPLAGQIIRGRAPLYGRSLQENKKKEKRETPYSHNTVPPRRDYSGPSVACCLPEVTNTSATCLSDLHHPYTYTKAAPSTPSYAQVVASSTRIGGGRSRRSVVEHAAAHTLRTEELSLRVDDPRATTGSRRITPEGKGHGAVP